MCGLLQGYNALDHRKSGMQAVFCGVRHCVTATVALPDPFVALHCHKGACLKQFGSVVECMLWTPGQCQYGT